MSTTEIPADPVKTASPLADAERPGRVGATGDAERPGRVSATGDAERPGRVSAIHDPSTSVGQLGLAFKRAMVAVRKVRGRETNRHGQISFAQYGLLFGLAGHCERSARELAEHADLSPATVTQMLESLEAEGLVTRTRSEQDRRVVLSVLTERGAAVVAERQAEMEPKWQSALAEFSESELAAASRVLNRLADYFDAMLDTAVED